MCGEIDGDGGNENQQEEVMNYNQNGSEQSIHPYAEYPELFIQNSESRGSEAGSNPDSQDGENNIYPYQDNNFDSNW